LLNTTRRIEGLPTEVPTTTSANLAEVTWSLAIIAVVIELGAIVNEGGLNAVATNCSV
jgi:hypothetical protein